MTRWPESPLCAFDLETTDRDPRTARIVSACVATFDGADLHIRTWLLDPGIPIPPETTAIHGITTDRARAEGQEYLAGYLEIRQALLDAWKQGHAVVAFNASYDLTVIESEGTRMGFAPLELGTVLDPYVIDREMDRYRSGKRTLKAVCEVYGVTLVDAHEAQADAVAAGQLTRALLARYPQLAELDIMTDQAAWHAERQRNFAEYLAKAGRDGSDVDGSWPIRTPVTVEVLERTEPAVESWGRRVWRRIKEFFGLG